MMKVLAFVLLVAGAAAEGEQQLTKEQLESMGLDTFFESEAGESADKSEQENGPSMAMIEEMVKKNKEQMELKVKEQQASTGGARTEAEMQALRMESRLRSTMKAKVRAMVERIGEDERAILKGQKQNHAHEVDHSTEHMTLPPMDTPGGLPSEHLMAPRKHNARPECAVLFFHGLGHSRSDKKIEDVFFKTDSFKATTPMTKVTKRCERHKELTTKVGLVEIAQKVDKSCEDEYAPDGEVDKCMMLLPKAPIAKHGANGDHPVASWFSQEQLGTGADFKPPSHGIDFDEANRHTKGIHKIIETLNKKYSIPTEKIFLSGFSQGATVAALAALSYPQSLGGLAMYGGQLLGKDNLIKMTHEENREIPIVWGYSMDDDISLPSLHDEGVALLASNGFKIRSHRYPGLHYMTQKAFDSMTSLVNARVEHWNWANMVQKMYPDKFELMVNDFAF